MSEAGYNTKIAKGDLIFFFTFYIFTFYITSNLKHKKKIISTSDYNKPYSCPKQQQKRRLGCKSPKEGRIWSVKYLIRVLCDKVYVFTFGMKNIQRCIHFGLWIRFFSFVTHFPLFNHFILFFLLLRLCFFFFFFTSIYTSKNCKKVALDVQQSSSQILFVPVKTWLLGIGVYLIAPDRV